MQQHHLPVAVQRRHQREQRTPQAVLRGVGIAACGCDVLHAVRRQGLRGMCSLAYSWAARASQPRSATACPLLQKFITGAWPAACAYSNRPAVVFR